MTIDRKELFGPNDPEVADHWRLYRQAEPQLRAAWAARGNIPAADLRLIVIDGKARKDGKLLAAVLPVEQAANLLGEVPESIGRFSAPVLADQIRRPVPRSNTVVFVVLVNDDGMLDMLGLGAFTESSRGGVA